MRCAARLKDHERPWRCGSAIGCLLGQGQISVDVLVGTRHPLDPLERLPGAFQVAGARGQRQKIKTIEIHRERIRVVGVGLELIQRDVPLLHLTTHQGIRLSFLDTLIVVRFFGLCRLNLLLIALDALAIVVHGILLPLVGAKELWPRHFWLTQLKKVQRLVSADEHLVIVAPGIGQVRLVRK